MQPANFTYSPLGKSFVKAFLQRKKLINAITNQNETLEALTNKNIYKEIFDKIVKEKFDEIRKLAEEINHDYLTYNFKSDTAKKKIW